MALADRSVDETLDYVVDSLAGASIGVEASASNVYPDGRETATILLKYTDDKPRALQILRGIGVPVNG